MHAYKNYYNSSFFFYSVLTVVEVVREYAIHIRLIAKQRFNERGGVFAGGYFTFLESVYWNKAIHGTQ